MQEFIREILNNTSLMMMLMFIFAFSLSLLAFEKFRKIIFGSIVSSIVSISLTIASRVDSINEIFSLIFKNAFFIRYSEELETISGLNRYLFIFVEAFDLKNTYSIVYVDYFGYVTKDIFFGFKSFEYKNDLISEEEYNLELTDAKQNNLSRLMLVIRI